MPAAWLLLHQAGALPVSPPTRLPASKAHLATPGLAPGGGASLRIESQLRHWGICAVQQVLHLDQLLLLLVWLRLLLLLLLAWLLLLLVRLRLRPTAAVARLDS